LNNFWGTELAGNIIAEQAIGIQAPGAELKGKPHKDSPLFLWSSRKFRRKNANPNIVFN